MTSKVYILQHPLRRGTPLDITDAARYGTLQSPFFPPTYNTILDTEDAVERLEKGLVSYTQEDYIVAIGDPVLIGLAMAIAARNADGNAQILKWNRAMTSNGTRSAARGNYVPVQISLDVQ